VSVDVNVCVLKPSASLTLPPLIITCGVALGVGVGVKVDVGVMVGVKVGVGVIVCVGVIDGVGVGVMVGVGGITGITSTQPQLGITDVVITSVMGPVPVKAEKLDYPLNIVLENNC
jgi:hypothetical protein